MPDYQPFSIKFVIDKPLDADQVTASIAARMKKAIFVVMSEKILPKVKAAAPVSKLGTKHARDTFRVDTMEETATSIRYGIRPDKAHQYIFFTLPPGTPPHVIRPKRKKALRFFVSEVTETDKTQHEEQKVFARYVLHPGYPGVDWVTPALQGLDIPQYIIQEFKQQKG